MSMQRRLTVANDDAFLTILALFEVEASKSINLYVVVKPVNIALHLQDSALLYKQLVAQAVQ
jgi:hypothetical protein